MNNTRLYEKGEDFVIFINEITKKVTVFDSGIYYYKTKYENTIEDIENDNFVTFELTKEERKKINYLFLRLNKNDFIEEVFSFYNIEDRNQVIVKKDDFKNYELEILLDNDFDNYFCYTDSNYDYLLIERKGDLQ